MSFRISRRGILGFLLGAPAAFVLAAPAFTQVAQVDTAVTNQTQPLIRIDNGQPLYVISNNEIGTYAEFRGQRKITAFTISYRASVPVNITYRFYHNDLTAFIDSAQRQSKIGALVAEFTETNLPAGDHIRTVRLPASKQFVWGTEVDTAGILEGPELPPSPFGGNGFFSVRITPADGSATPVGGVQVVTPFYNPPQLASNTLDPAVFAFSYGGGLLNLDLPAQPPSPPFFSEMRGQFFPIETLLPYIPAEGMGIYHRVVGINLTRPIVLSTPTPAPTPTPTPTPTPAPSAAVLSSLSLTSPGVRGGNSLVGFVQLTAPAPSGGAVVALASSNTVARVPASVFVPAGASAAGFPITTSPVSVRTPVTITASRNGVTRTAILNVRPRQ
ncbi:MAG: hypothetical protein H7145_23250 [Akkermansiaceae bacterium]|nr:hypothetical protein [Armatimonadota bacterium]